MTFSSSSLWRLFAGRHLQHHNPQCIWSCCGLYRVVPLLHGLSSGSMFSFRLSLYCSPTRIIPSKDQKPLQEEATLSKISSTLCISGHLTVRVYLWWRFLNTIDEAVCSQRKPKRRHTLAIWRTCVQLNAAIKRKIHLHASFIRVFE